MGEHRGLRDRSIFDNWIYGGRKAKARAFPRCAGANMTMSDIFLNSVKIRAVAAVTLVLTRVYTFHEVLERCRNAAGTHFRRSLITSENTGVKRFARFWNAEKHSGGET